MSQQQNIAELAISGGGSNTTKSLALGGYCSEMSAGVIQSGNVNNLFDMVARSRMIAGEFQYLCCYVRIFSNTEGLPSARFWLDRDTVSDENELSWALEGSDPQFKYRYSPYKTYDGATRDTYADTAALDLTQFSCSAWFRVPNGQDFTTTAIIVIKQNFDVHNYGLWFDSAEKLNGGFDEVTTGTNHYATSPLSYNDGLWHHACVTYDQVTVRLYVDGVEKATHATTTSPQTGTNNLAIGGNANVADRFFTGDIDEVYVWNNDLTAGEVSSLWSAGVIPQTGARVFRENFGASQQFYKYAPSKHFNGSSDFTDGIDVDLSQFTVSAWFLSAQTGVTQEIVSKGVEGSELSSDNYNFDVRINTANQISGGFEESAGTDHFATLGSPTVTDYKWHHVVLTYDGAEVELFLDGFTVATHATATTPNTNNHVLRIGRSGGSGTGYFSGYIDEVYVWNNDITMAEVTELYFNSVIPQEGNIVYEQHYGDDNGSQIAQTINTRFQEPTGLVWQKQDTPPEEPNMYARDLSKYTNNNSYNSIYPVWFRREIKANSNDSIDNKAMFKLSGRLRRENTGQGGQGSGGSGGSKPPPDVENMMFGAVGDTDCKDMFNRVISVMVKRDVMMPLFLGDLTYNGRTCWKDRVKKHWTIGGFGADAMIVIGNHDEDNGKRKGWIADFKLGSGWWYHVHENVAIIGMDSESSFSVNSNQYDFVLSKLKKASSDNNVDWIIVMIHRPFISAESEHDPNEGGKADIYLPLFTKYKVDLVLQAHNHNYQRSKLLKDNTSDHENPKIVESTSPFAKHRGFVVVTCGLGGHDKGDDLYSLDNTPSWQGFQQRKDNGFFLIEFHGTNNEMCTGKLINVNNETKDMFELM